MIAENQILSIARLIYAEEDAKAYAVLDGASIPDLLPKLDEYQPETICLFRGELEPDMAEVAPYLIELHPESDFTRWEIEQGWGEHWGIFVVTRRDIREMRRHFRSLLIVFDPASRRLRFRYYDPRVMRLFLPTCNSEELATLFGPVDQYILEDADQNIALRYRFDGGKLVSEKLKLV